MVQVLLHAQQGFDQAFRQLIFSELGIIGWIERVFLDLEALGCCQCAEFLDFQAGLQLGAQFGIVP